MVSRAYTWHPYRGGSAAEAFSGARWAAGGGRSGGGGRRAVLGRRRRAAGGGGGIGSGLAGEFCRGPEILCSRSHPCEIAPVCEIRGRSLESVSDGGGLEVFLPTDTTVHSHRLERGAGPSGAPLADF